MNVMVFWVGQLCWCGAFVFSPFIGFLRAIPFLRRQSFVVKYLFFAYKTKERESGGEGEGDRSQRTVGLCTKDQPSLRSRISTPCSWAIFSSIYAIIPMFKLKKTWPGQQIILSFESCGTTSFYSPVVKDSSSYLSWCLSELYRVRLKAHYRRPPSNVVNW
jgi:hypothetical protein